MDRQKLSNPLGKAESEGVQRLMVVLDEQGRIFPPEILETIRLSYLVGHRDGRKNVLDSFDTNEKGMA